MVWSDLFYGGELTLCKYNLYLINVIYHKEQLFISYFHLHFFLIFFHYFQFIDMNLYEIDAMFLVPVMRMQ